MATSPQPPTSTPTDHPAVDVVRQALEATGHTWLQRVAVVTEGGCVVLRGVVPSYYLKQLAQVTALAVPGVETLRNDLRVTARAPRLPARPAPTDDRDPAGGTGHY
jgi:osmotically-inducible protein OsmY